MNDPGSSVQFQPNICISLPSPMSVLSVTDSFYDLLGFAADDFLSGKITLPSRIHAHDQDIAEVLFSTEIEPASGRFNIRLRHADGRIRCVKGQYAKTINSISNTITLNLLLLDAKSLSQQQGNQTMMVNFKAMMENSDDYIYFKDINHVFTGASQTLVSITAPSEHWTDLIGQTDYDVFSEALADTYYSLEKQVFAGILVAHEVQEILDNDGNKGWVDNRKYPIRNDDGEIISLFGIARDITKLKLSEESSKAASQYSRSLIEASLDPLITISAEGKITDANTATEKVTGVDRDSLIGSDFANYFTNPEEARKSYQQAFSQGSVTDYSLAIRHVSGKITNVLYNSTVYHDTNGKALGVFAAARDITERKKLEAALHQQALYDELTKLPNRRLLNDRLSQTIAASKRSHIYGALMFMDLDNFKPLNDKHGHEVGDMLLIETANRLTSCVREIDTVARLGRDEFVVLLNKLNTDKTVSTSESVIIAEKIRTALSEPYVFKVHHTGKQDNTVEHCCTGSIGVIVFNGTEGTQKDIIKWADDSMYEAKEAGRNQVRLSVEG